MAVDGYSIGWGKLAGGILKINYPKGLRKNGMKETGKTLNLTEGNPLKLILLFAIPVFLGRLFQMMYSLIDTKIVGSILGEEALAGSWLRVDPL